MLTRILLAFAVAAAVAATVGASAGSSDTGAVLTSAKPAASKASLSAGILQFMGLTPRRKAAWRGMPLRALRCAAAPPLPWRAA